jgi:hypothetical protein
MYYVTNPDGVVAQIQSLIDERYRKTETPPVVVTVASPALIAQIPETPTRPIGKKESQRHSLDTREKIRDVLR